MKDGFANITNEIVLYQPDEEIKLEVRMENESVWLNLGQLALLFNRGKSVISRHISSIYKEQELDKNSTVAKIDNYVDETVLLRLAEREKGIDDTVYHIGASIKDLGKKWFAFCKMNINAEEIISRI